MKNTIIIVDDVKQYLDALERALSFQYDIITALSLDEAIQKMNESISLALVDIRLSEKDFMNRDGIKFLSWLKENYPAVPVIMMSAYKDHDAAVEALNLGADYYIKKPIELKELKEKINELITKNK